MENNRKTILIIAIIILLGLAIYLNRSYAHIYNKIGAANLKSPDQTETYLIANNYMNNPANFTYDALGDSLTAGVGTDNYNQAYPYLLAQSLTRSINGGGNIILTDRAAPGMRTSELLATAVPIAIADNPDIITLLIGVNDIHDHVSPADFQKNYEEILSRLSSETKAKIYVINIPLLGADELLWPPYNFYFDARTRQFNRIIAELAATYDVNYIDLYAPTANLFKKAGEHYSADLFHPSASGYKIWADIIYAGINK